MIQIVNLVNMKKVKYIVELKYHCHFNGLTTY